MFKAKLSCMPFVKSIRSDWVLKVLVPLAFALLWLVLNTPKFSSPCLEAIDPWIYLGLNLHYEFLANIFSDQYYTTRLPVVIPGFFAYKLFDVYTAALLIRLFKLLLIITPLTWLLVGLTKDYLITILALSILFFDPTFLVSIATDYVNSYGMGYAALATTCLTATCLKPNWRLWLVMAGIAQALMVYTYLFLVTFFITQIAYLLILNHFTKRLPLYKILFYLGIGGIGCTIILGCFAFYHKGYFFFWWPQLRAARELTAQITAFGGPGSPWKSPFSKWIPEAVWLILPLIAFFLGLEYLKKKIGNFRKAFLSSSRFDKYFVCSCLLISQFVILFLFYSFFEIIGYNFFELDFTACYIFPASIITVGIVFSEIKKNNINLKDYKYSLVGICILTAFLLSSSHPIYFGIYSLMIVIALVRIKSISTKRLSLALFILTQIFLNYYTLQNKQIDVNFVGGFGTVNQAATPEPNDSYFLMVKISCLIKEIIPNKEKPLVWYDSNPEKEGLNNFFLATAETFLGGYVTEGPNAAFSKYFPETNDIMLGEAFKKNKMIVLLSSDSNAIGKAKQALKQKGYGWDVLKQEKFHLGQKEFLMLAFLLKPIGKE